MGCRTCGQKYPLNRSNPAAQQFTGMGRRYIGVPNPPTTPPPPPPEVTPESTPSTPPPEQQPPKEP